MTLADLMGGGGYGAMGPGGYYPGMGRRQTPAMNDYYRAMQEQMGRPAEAGPSVDITPQQSGPPGPGPQQAGPPGAMNPAEMFGGAAAQMPGMPGVYGGMAGGMAQDTRFAAAGLPSPSAPQGAGNMQQAGAAPDGSPQGGMDPRMAAMQQARRMQMMQQQPVGYGRPMTLAGMAGMYGRR